MMSPVHIYKIIRSKRRTIALVVEPDATLTVRAPYRVSLGYITSLVTKKYTWIYKKQQQARSYEITPEKTYVDGQIFLYLGQSYTMKIYEGKTIFFDDTSMIVLFPSKFVTEGKKMMIMWYKKMAKQKLQERINFYAARTDWRYVSMRITSAKTRWGSCSKEGSINLTWRLIMAPLRAIDYVIVHELAHTIECNHSTRFWDLVKQVLPEYKQEEKWLRENQKIMKV